MAAIDSAPDTIPSPPPESDECAIARIEAAPGVEDHAPRYVASVLGELRHIVAGVACPVHDCAPSLVVEFASEESGTFEVVSYGCCSELDRAVADALRPSRLFRFVSIR